MSKPSAEPVASPADDTAVRELHLQLGGRFEPYDGVEAVADYGSFADELRALRTGVALIDRSWVEVLELTGEDRSRFLGSQMTSDVAALGPGEANYGLFVSAKGRVEADAVVLAGSDRLLIELPAGCSVAIGERLSKYVIVDRVEIDSSAGWRALTLAGPRAPELLTTVLGEAPAEPWRHRAASCAGHELWAAYQPLFRRPAFTLWQRPGSVADILARLVAEEGVVPVGWRALEGHRVELGWPAFGRDFGPENFPQECGLEDDAVSYTKGCYLGQEVVARIHYRGGVQRRLCQLRLTGVEAGALGSSLLGEGREVGRLTSFAALPEGELGLAILHRRAEAGAKLEVEGGGTAEVVELSIEGR